MSTNKGKPDCDVSVTKRLFLGEIHQQNLFPFPKIEVSESETLNFVVESISRFATGKESLVRKFDREGYQADDYIQAMRELGLFGLIIPEEHGGLGLSSKGYARALQQLGNFDGSTALTAGAHSSIGMKGLLLFGSDEQKATYLPRLATGELIAAFCLTEPLSGSDAASISTTATKRPDGSWVLNGEKLWISNGAFAGFFTVFARTDTSEGKITAFIVERAWPGISIGSKEDKMGIRASATTTVRFDNVVVPPNGVLGEVGKGFKIAMAILNSGRTGLGGGCVGAMKRCIALATEHANQRKQFGKTIGNFGLVREKIALMTVSCFVSESMVQMIGHYVDEGVDDFSIEAALSKIYSTESLWMCANEALQIAGGNGFMREFPYEVIVRDARINLIFEGTNEILRLYAALSALKDAGDYLKEVGKGVTNLLKDPIKGFGVLADYATRKFSPWNPTVRRLDEVLPNELRDLGKMVEASVAGLSRTVESVLKEYRGSIVDQQLILKRLADVAVDLFGGLCVLSRVTSELQSANSEARTALISIATIFCHQAKRRIDSNLSLARGAEEDSAVLGLAEYVLKEGKFPWDII